MDENNNLRLDGNIASQSDVFRQYGDDAPLMKSLLFYMAYKQQCSLFKNEGTLEPNEVNKVLGFSRGYLLQSHPSPSQYDKLKAQFKTTALLQERLDKDTSPDLKMKLFDNRFENALYRLNTEAIRFEKGFKHYTTEDGNQMIVQVAETIQFLDKLQIRSIKTPAGRQKYVYDYRLSENFVKNFGLYFSFINFSHYNTLRTNNLEDLYVFLMNLRNLLKSQNEGLDTVSTDRVSFDRLCVLANVYTEPSDTTTDETQRFRDQKRRLTKKMALVEQVTNMGLKLTYSKSTGKKYYYTTVLTFDLNMTTLIDEKAIRADLFLSSFCGILLEQMKKTYPDMLLIEDNAERRILEYIKHKNRGIKMIEKTFSEAHLETFQSNDVRNFSSRMSNLPIMLMKCETLNDIKLALLGQFTTK